MIGGDSVRVTARPAGYMGFPSKRHGRPCTVEVTITLTLPFPRKIFGVDNNICPLMLHVSMCHCCPGFEVGDDDIQSVPA